MDSNAYAHIMLSKLTGEDEGKIKIDMLVSDFRKGADGSTMNVHYATAASFISEVRNS